MLTYRQFIYENQTCERISKAQLDAFESFLDKIFKEFNIDFEFTKHFLERLSDNRNDPCIKLKELAQLMTKIHRKKGAPLTKNVGSEVVVKDLQSKLNIPFIIDYDRKKDEFVFTAKTIMRKTNFSSPDKAVTY